MHEVVYVHQTSLLQRVVPLRAAVNVHAGAAALVAIITAEQAIVSLSAATSAQAVASVASDDPDAVSTQEAGMSAVFAAQWAACVATHESAPKRSTVRHAVM